MFITDITNKKELNEAAQILGCDRWKGGQSIDSFTPPMPIAVTAIEGTLTFDSNNGYGKNNIRVSINELKLKRMKEIFSGC